MNMKSKINTKTILLILMGIAIIILLWRGCSISKQFGNQQSTIDSLQLANQRLDSLTNKQGQTIYTQQSIIADNKEALSKLTDTIFDLKRKDEKNISTLAYFKTHTKTVISNVEVPYVDSVANLKWKDSVFARCADVIALYDSLTIPVPANALSATPYFRINMTVKKEGVVINDLTIPDTMQLRFVEHKHGLFKPKTVEVQFFHSNPLIYTEQANSAFYTPKKKSFFKRAIIPALIGLGVGLIVTSSAR